MRTLIGLVLILMVTIIAPQIWGEKLFAPILREVDPPANPPPVEPPKEGDARVTRLWRSNIKGRKFGCTGFYIRPIGLNGAWVVSAGHCIPADEIGRDGTGYVFSKIDWRGMVLSRMGLHLSYYDVAVGSTPDPRVGFGPQEFFTLAEKDPSPGDTLWIHGFPEGKEVVGVGVLTKNTDPSYPGVLMMQVPDCKMDELNYFLHKFPETCVVAPGSSGSPILNYRGEVAGVLWGLFPSAKEPISERQINANTVAFTPVSKLRKLLDLMEIKDPDTNPIFNNRGGKIPRGGEVPHG